MKANHYEVFESPDGEEEIEVAVYVSGKFTSATLHYPGDVPNIEVLTELPSWLTHDEVVETVMDVIQYDSYYDGEAQFDDGYDRYDNRRDESYEN